MRTRSRPSSLFSSGSSHHRELVLGRHDYERKTPSCIVPGQGLMDCSLGYPLGELWPHHSVQWLVENGKGPDAGQWLGRVISDRIQPCMNGKSYNIVGRMVGISEVDTDPKGYFACSKTGGDGPSSRTRLFNRLSLLFLPNVLRGWNMFFPYPFMSRPRMEFSLSFPLPDRQVMDLSAGKHRQGSWCSSPF